MMNREHYFKSNQDLVEVLSREIASILAQSIQEHGRAALAVSGGSTPKTLFQTLSRIPIEWDKVVIGLCDERWVSSIHHDSNARMVREFLLQNEAKSAYFVPMYETTKSPEEAEKSCHERLEKSLFPLDVVLLGMGEDGHTASLFPNNPVLVEAFLDQEKHCFAMHPETAPYARMSLGKAAILSAKKLFLYFEGAKKIALYKKVLEEKDPMSKPIAAFLEREDLEVYYAS